MMWFAYHFEKLYYFYLSDKFVYHELDEEKKSENIIMVFDQSQMLQSMKPWIYFLSLWKSWEDLLFVG